MAAKSEKMLKQLAMEKGGDENIYVYKQWRYKPIPQPKERVKPPEKIDFELYIKEKCENKIKILKRETFHEIKKPIIIMFNHFREMCYYHKIYLNRLYELAGKYGEHIEFIAADIYDIDIIFPGRSPLSFYSILVRPEDITPYTYAINEHKCIYELMDAYKELDTLRELCENLLKQKLFPSQTIPENNENKLIKICVHHNHEELVEKSTKNIFIIINFDKLENNEIQYDKVALALKDYNLDIVYMQAEENYIPFKYYAYCFLLLCIFQ